MYTKKYTVCINIWFMFMYKLSLFLWSHTTCFTSRSSTTSFVFPALPVPLQHLWVIRSFYSIADVARYNSRQRLSLHIATAAQHPFTSSLSDISSQATLQSPGFENENLDRPKPGMLIANMLCTFVQIPHHNLVPFFQHSKSMTFFLWSIGINLYHNKAHISKLSRF